MTTASSGGAGTPWAQASESTLKPLPSAAHPSAGVCGPLSTSHLVVNGTRRPSCPNHVKSVTSSLPNGALGTYGIGMVMVCGRGRLDYKFILRCLIDKLNSL